VDLARRLEEHSKRKGAKYTKYRGPFTLLPPRIVILIHSTKSILSLAEGPSPTPHIDTLRPSVIPDIFNRESIRDPSFLHCHPDPFDFAQEKGPRRI
jgi:hypothetical protein